MYESLASCFVCKGTISAKAEHCPYYGVRIMVKTLCHNNKKTFGSTCRLLFISLSYFFSYWFRELFLGLSCEHR